MEAMIEREDEALLGPIRSKFVNQHHPLPDFDGTAEAESEIGGEEDERIDEDVSSGSPFGGTGSNQGSETPSGLEHQLLSGFLPAQKSSGQILHRASVEISENDIPHLFTSSEASSEDHLNGYTNGTILNIAGTVILEEPIPEIDDLEKVINGQEIYDLLCPKCNTCITKRVILRRKTKIEDKSTSEPTKEELTNEAAFECLSCFSIFIPIGRGFKLIFGCMESNPPEPPPVATGAVTDDANENPVEDKEVQDPIPNSPAPPLPSPSNPNQGVNVGDSGQENLDDTVLDMPPETEPLFPAKNTTDAAAAAGGDGPSDIDVIKSIAYGGLLESIASLSVVTSAAGADAKTLNIVALAAANMFGGLFVLAHDLRVLKNDSERYKEVLGQPGHFTFHAVVAVLSYIVFGLIPLVVYGFSFRESDNSNYKLIAVALASLVCIVLLSLGKAHTRTRDRDYIKTLTYYVSLWVTVCGVSYLAGELIHFLLEKLGLFESTTSTSVAFITPWASY